MKNSFVTAQHEAPKSEPLPWAAETQQPSAPLEDIGHAAPAWYENANVWITLAFVIFVVLVAKYLVAFIGKSLDARAAKIRDQLEQVSRLRAEAEALLASYKKQQETMLKEAEAILATARRDAETLRNRAGEDLKASLERRSQQAQEKIARAETEAVIHIRTQMIDKATESARKMIGEQIKNEKDDPAIVRALEAIAEQIH